MRIYRDWVRDWQTSNKRDILILIKIFEYKKEFFYSRIYELTSRKFRTNQFLNTECAAICQNFGRLDYSQNHRISIEWTYVCKETNPWKIFNHLLMPFLVAFVNMTQITLSLFCNVCFCSKCLMIFSSQVFHLDQNLYYLHVCDVINIA